MKILDRYITKNFLIGYVISFCVLMGLRVIIDLFVNLDEFTEHADLGTLAVFKNIVVFYMLNGTIYFRDFAGMIGVVAAVFSLGRMIRNNELVAMMSSGISLKRVIGPIIILSMFMTGVLVIDQELIIPPLADKLVRSHDDVPGQESYDVWFINDGSGSLVCSLKFDVKSSTLDQPTIITRSRKGDSRVWETTGRIDAEKAVYNYETNRWDLIGGQYVERDDYGGVKSVSYYSSDITPKDIPVRCQSRNKTLLSSRQLGVLIKQGTKVEDLAQLRSQKQFRITDPVINFVMLMIALPLLVCRDPKGMKSAVLISFCLTTACFISTFICKMLAAEVIFGRIMPEVWAWMPIFIFMPIAFIELDSMKT